MRTVYRLAFAMLLVASVPMILGNPVIAADFNAELRGDAAAIRLAVTLGAPRHYSWLRTGAEKAALASLFLRR